MAQEYWITVVDDDISNLKIAGSILSGHGMRVTAMSTGAALLEYLDDGNEPDLILLDVQMPVMDGLETLEKLRAQERERNIRKGAEPAGKYDGMPVVLLTADDNAETADRGLALGTLDIIKKPFDPVSFVQRIESIVTGCRHMRELSDSITKDKLTGLMSKAGADRLMRYELGRCGGTLMLLDIDGFRMINEHFGHDAGDRFLTACAVILKQNIRADDMAARTDGDTFVVFLKDVLSEDKVTGLVRVLNSKLCAEAYRMFGNKKDITVGVSCGAVIAEKGHSFEELLRTAERMLISAKRDGKHGCAVFSRGEKAGNARRHTDELARICESFDEHNTEHKALCTGSESFGMIYRYIMRHIQRYNGIVQKVLVTAENIENIPASELSAKMEQLSGIAAGMLRNSDIIYRCSPDQLLLLLPMLSDADLPGVMERISTGWNNAEDPGRRTEITYVSECVGNVLPQYPDIEGLDWRYAKLNLPTERLLMDTLKDLYSSIPKRIARLEGFYADIDSAESIKSYKTEVHAMKSAAALIGLMQISGLAKMLESYAAAGDAQSVRTLHEPFLKEFRKAYDAIGKTFGFEAEEMKKQDGKAMLPPLLGVLESSLKEMDMETADRVITKIRSYSYDERTTELIDKLARASVELDDSAYDIIKELTS